FLEGRNRSLIGSEIVDFQNATLTGNVGTDKIYQLTSPFTRGIRVTPQSHAANENFYLLSGYKLNLPAQRSDIGKTFYFKAVSPGQTLADVAPVTLLFQGKAFQVVIDDFSPRQGAIGATVTITGLGFTGATSVSFNNVPAQSFIVDSDTTLTAVVATGTTTGKIRVTAPLGIGVSAVDFTIVADGSMLSIQDEGNLVGARPTLNFIGPNVIATDNPSSDRVDVTINPPTIQDEGVVIAARPTLNFIGLNVTAVDNSSQNRVDVTINSQDFISGLIEQPTIKSYTLDYRVFRAYRLSQISLGTKSGTATVSLQINGSNVVGLTNLAISSTLQTAIATSGNLANIGSKIDFAVSAASSPIDLAFTLEFEYA
ncbi:MAG: IPT/TIG domain-containing protein, partial [Pseudanabaena sp.]